MVNVSVTCLSVVLRRWLRLYALYWLVLRAVVAVVDPIKTANCSIRDAKGEELLVWTTVMTDKPASTATTTIKDGTKSTTSTTTISTFRQTITTTTATAIIKATVSTSRLPPDVAYDAELNQVYCANEHSCREFTLTNCHVVECTGRHSCQEATMRNITGAVSCSNYAACQGARIEHAHNVACGMDSINSCYQATIESVNVGDAILCFGAYACVSDAQDRPLLQLKVGAHGQVRCVEGVDVNSCANMVVEIAHSRRACIVANLEEAARGPNHCAVICEGERECDVKSIQFRVP